jgi:hypothetical protein
MGDYALLIGGTFERIERHEEKPVDIPHKGVTWHEVAWSEGEAAFEGLEGGKWMIRTALPTLSELRQNKLAALASARWERETGGTTFNGFTVPSDAASQTKYIGAVVAAQLDPATTIYWKMADGTFVKLNASAIVSLALAVRAHVQACFDREKQLVALIEAAQTPEALEAVDITSGWPGQ